MEKPNPVFEALKQAIGGSEGGIRVAMQYMFQAWGARGNNKFRGMLLNTGAEELGHIEMLSTAAQRDHRRVRAGLPRFGAAEAVVRAIAGPVPGLVWERCAARSGEPAAAKVDR